MTDEQIAVIARNAYYLAWNGLSDAQKDSKYGTAAQEAASRGTFTDAAAMVLAATVTFR